MIKKLYTLYDCKSETYTPPLLHDARGVAVRALADAVNEVNSQRQGDLFNHPEDFTLFEIGEYDTRTGQLTVYEARTHVVDAMSLKVSA